MTQADDLRPLIAKGRAGQPFTIPETARLCGVSTNRAYGYARTGQIAGVPVLRVGPKVLRVPGRKLLRALGLLDEEASHDDR